MPENAPHPPLVWIDCEMSGLDPETERLLEIAVLVTDSELEILGEGPDLVIHQDDALLEAMDEWNTKHHAGSGLTEAVRRSELSTEAAEDQVLAFLARHCEEGQCPLAGNSVGHDRRFLARYMPRLAAFLHYRTIDVSTIKELARRWHPEAFERSPKKVGAHRALDDIRESIEELRYWRGAVFRDA